MKTLTELLGDDLAAFDDELRFLFDNLVEISEMAFVAGESLIKLKAELDAKRNEKLAAGVDGNNAETRAANLRLALSAEYEQVREAEAAARVAQHSKTIADLKLKQGMSRLRLIEAATRISV